MKFQNVCLESIAVALPDEIWTSANIEERLAPMYERLKLPFGRLELMTGIRERRHWPHGTRASDASAAAGRAVLARSSLKPEQLGVFIHGAVSRDMMEPATAAFAHRKIGLPATTQLFDVSNACLGFLNGMVTLAGLIESGQIDAGMVVSGENGRPLIEETLRHLLDHPLSRNEIKPFFANLTIGSGAVGAILCHRKLINGHPHRLLGGIGRAATQHSELCQGDSHGAESLAMQTNSEELLIAGVDLARTTWQDFVRETGWSTENINRFICHQVGSVHRRKLFESLGLPLERDFSTFETLGNMGSASLPATLATAVGAGAVRAGDKVALLGIGSGLNCLMLALEW
ncbi:MAG TPA: 3-oxoacyl-ACP synthase III [Opitutaceae bacterium]|nr:3-oxoacyl-ACP synthase III [Opitutaceae bacterium]